MKNMFKTAALLSSAALVGASIYVLTNDKLRRKTAKKITRVMDNAEAMISKKMN